MNYLDFLIHPHLSISSSEIQSLRHPRIEAALLPELAPVVNPTIFDLLLNSITYGDRVDRVSAVRILGEESILDFKLSKINRTWFSYGVTNI